VTITLKNGRTVTKRVREAKGQPKNPLTPDELEAKFRDSAGRALDVERVLSILYAVRSLETVPDVSALARLMRADAR
jgi:2-methylcitrate dehydratase PrpD